MPKMNSMKALGDPSVRACAWPFVRQTSQYGHPATRVVSRAASQLVPPPPRPRPHPPAVGVMEELLEEGCVIVATSNRAPWELNSHGLHEDLFGHFQTQLGQVSVKYEVMIAAMCRTSWAE
jgi:AFG1-like ATPase